MPPEFVFFVPLIPLISLTFSGKVLLMQNERGRKKTQTCLNCSVLPSVLPFYTSVFMLRVSNLKREKQKTIANNGHMTL